MQQTTDAELLTTIANELECITSAKDNAEVAEHVCNALEAMYSGSTDTLVQHFKRVYSKDIGPRIHGAEAHIRTQMRVRKLLYAVDGGKVGGLVVDTVQRWVDEAKREPGRKMSRRDHLKARWRRLCSERVEVTIPTTDVKGVYILVCNVYK